MSTTDKAYKVVVRETNLVTYYVEAESEEHVRELRHQNEYPYATVEELESAEFITIEEYE